MSVKISTDQLKAISEMKNGCILCGKVGSGKSRAALLYYFLNVCNGATPIEVTDPENFNKNFNNWKLYLSLDYSEMKNPKNLYIVTTAKKRESLEWNKECLDFLLSVNHPEESISNVLVTVDSWNNIKKYKKIHSSFFIFDEQRVVGKGEWVKAFLDITRKNKWILLSATPGDSWSDYIPVFIANGFYKNRTEFQSKHCVFSRFSKYPKIEKYVGLKELNQNRDKILVNMKDMRFTTRFNVDMISTYDAELYRVVQRERWNPFDSSPIEETSKLAYTLRRVVNEDESKLKILDQILGDFDKVIIFYNFNYELDMIKKHLDGKIEIAEWNGIKHQEIPNSEKWVYLVQYLAGSEGWNCIDTNCIVFFSQTYSYKTLEQASGRIDRVNTHFQNLYYFHIRSNSNIDLAIKNCLKNKKKFNERKYFK